MKVEFASENRAQEEKINSSFFLLLNPKEDGMRERCSALKFLMDVYHDTPLTILSRLKTFIKEQSFLTKS